MAQQAAFQHANSPATPEHLLSTLPEYVDRQQVFLYLVVFRWASLLPAVWLVWTGRGGPPVQILQGVLLALAVLHTFLLTWFHRPFNRLLQRRPVLLAVDILLTTALLFFSGGERSPYYFYVLSPLLAGAFFFGIRGASLAILMFTPLYLSALWVVSHNDLAQLLATSPARSELAFIQLAGAWSVALLFGYASLLLGRLKPAYLDLAAARDHLHLQNAELQATHRQLKIIHDLTLSLQAATDVQSVQRQVLRIVTSELGFTRAAVGLVNPITEDLGGWLSVPERDSSLDDNPGLSLLPESGPLVKALLSARPQLLPVQEPLSSSPALNERLGNGPWLLIPLILRENPVGTLLLATTDSFDQLPEDQRTLLQSVASQAAVSLGTTMLCIDRAQRLAVEQERNRIAREIHDTVAQSLFGMIFSLDACVQMLPEQAETVRGELVELKGLASQVRAQVRHSILDIWPSGLTLERFQDDLSEYISSSCRQAPFQVYFSSQGDFNRLPAGIRRSLYRIAQEALTNAAHHAQTVSAWVSLFVEPDEVTLTVQDYGRGFDPQEALSRRSDREHFGLQGMQERVQALGGDCSILSSPGQGTTIRARMPLPGKV